MSTTRVSHRVLLVLASVTLACGHGGSARTLVYYESYDPRSLDPALSTDVPTGEMVTLMFDGLTAFDPDGRLVPGLADGWSVDRAGRHYVFHLRTGVKFHDGRPLTAGDVAASFRRVLDSKTTGGRAWPLLPIAGAAAFAAGTSPDLSGVRALGDTAVAIDLAEPLAIFPKFLAMPVASIVPDPAPADLAQRPVGTGPWRFVSWQHDDQLVFAKNPAYWGGAPLADSLKVRIIPEPLTLAAEFEARRVSVIEIPFSETARWQQLHPNWLVRKPALRVVYLALNNRRGALRDVRVRQAINHGVDVQEILQRVYAGRGIRARGAIPPILPGGDTSRAGYDYDPARARALLASAGYGQGLDLQLWISATNVPLARVAEAIQADLARVGIRAEIVARDASSQREAARAGKADMALLDWWADYPDADNFLYPLFASASFGPGGNYAFYSDPETDALITQARRTTDDSARVGLYRRIDERVYRAAPWLYLWFPVDLWARQPYVAGWDLPVIFNGQHWARAVATP
ncbi:MAG TPA: ABC transporter substrate-binding protein [Gemmatimonadales bacterium]|nr:ABC transporter substrate-binding protein [Gemmatimonadales bacterium]